MAGRVSPHKSAQQTLSQLKAADWREEAVLLNPLVWATRLAENPADEFLLDRAWAQRWLTPPAGHRIHPETLAMRNLAVENLRFFVRLAGAAPADQATKWALRNLDELEASLFQQGGASPEEVALFRRQLLGQDRPSRYKKAWATKTAKPARAHQGDWGKQGGHDRKKTADKKSK